MKEFITAELLTISPVSRGSDIERGKEYRMDANRIKSGL